jgi:hypothetical protein
VYNGSNYLRAAIDSALAQTYGNCEIIVVNDGSADDTEEICLSYGDHIRYFRKENGGVATALNLAIEKMRGEYFSWLSHDDVYYPRKVEAQIEALKRDGDMRKIVLGDFDVLNQDTGERISVILNKIADEYQITNSVFPVVKCLIAGCALLIHRSHFERVGTFNEKMRYVQDYNLWFRMFRKQKSLYVNELMYSVREHGEQDTKTHIIPHRHEEVALWTGYADELSEREMSEIFGSKFLFLFEMWQRMCACGNTNTELYERMLRVKNEQSISPKLKGALTSFGGGKDLVISIFGAGDQGLRTFHLLRVCGAEVHCFIDNNPQKHHTEIIDGVLCQSVNSAHLMKCETLVIVTMDNNADVLAQLNNLGFPYYITKRQLEKHLEDTK